MLLAGFVCFEYRLFGVMLFSGEETIRSTMVTADYGANELWHCFADVFLHGFPMRGRCIRILYFPSVYFILSGIQFNI